LITAIPDSQDQASNNKQGFRFSLVYWGVSIVNVRIVLSYHPLRIAREYAKFKALGYTYLVLRRIIILLWLQVLRKSKDLTQFPNKVIVDS